MQSEKTTKNTYSDLLHILEQPILDIETFFLSLKLFHSCIQKKGIQCQLDHPTACRQVVYDILKHAKHNACPILLGIELSAWSHVLQDMVFNQTLLNTLGKKRTREVLFYCHLFKHHLTLHKAFIQPQAFKTMAMLKALISYTYFTPKHQDYIPWCMAKKHFSHGLPSTVQNRIYAYLFMPKNLHLDYANALIEIDPKTHIKPLNLQPTKYTNITIQHHLHPSQIHIHHEDILTFLLSHQMYTLLDIFTVIIPLPWENIANLMLELNEIDKAYLLEQLQTCAINQSQFLSLGNLSTLTDHTHTAPQSTKVQYWIDVCKDIHRKNTLLMAKRQRHIDYICTHPIGLRDLEQLLLHFKQSIENPKTWLTAIFIDKYTLASKDFNATKQTLFSFTKKQHISHFLIERLFNTNSKEDPNYIRLKRHYIQAMSNLMKTYQQPNEWSLTWLFEQSTPMLNAHLDYVIEAFDYELDFTKVIRYSRHLVETQMSIANSKDYNLFSAITKIDLDCATNPILTI